MLLSLVDQRIETQIVAIEKKESLIKATAHLLTHSDNTVRIADCLENHSSTLQEKDVSEQGHYPVFGATGVCGYTNQPMCTKSAILIVKDGSGVGNVSFSEGSFSVLGTMNYLTAKDGFDIRYLYCCLLNFDFTPYRTGMAIPHIYFKDYSKGRIGYVDSDKRHKIAGLIFAIKDKLCIERQLLDLYKQQKQYLLRNMFV